MIGVIIPVYLQTKDDERLLKRALTSLADQTYTKFFTILCEDKNSNSYEYIKDDFSNKLNLIYLKNTKPYNGPGATRNVGIEWCIEHKIEGVIFVDSDDILLPHGVDALNYEFNHNLANAVINHNLVEDDHIYDISDTHINVWVTGNIYRTSFLKQYNIFFPETFMTNEDLAFALMVKGIDKKIFIINTPVYLHLNNKNSISKSINKGKDTCSIDYLKAIKTVYDYCLQKNINIDFLTKHIYSCYNFSQRALVFNTSTINTIREILSPMIIYLKNNNLLTYNILKNNRYNFCQYFEFENKLYFHQQSVYEWFKIFGIDLIKEGIFDESYSN